MREVCTPVHKIKAFDNFGFNQQPSEAEAAGFRFQIRKVYLANNRSKRKFGEIVPKQSRPRLHSEKCKAVSWATDLMQVHEFGEINKFDTRKSWKETTKPLKGILINKPKTHSSHKNVPSLL